MRKCPGSWFVAVAVVAAWVSSSGVAGADGGPKIRDSLWLPVGLNLGYSLNPEHVSNGFLVGPELSFVYLDDSGPWVGAYTDVLRDFGSETTRISAGAEAGYAIFGFDLGWVASFHDEHQHGLRGRFMFSLAAMHLYGGVGRVFGDPGAYTYGEVGLLVKFPINLWEDEPRWHRPHPPEPPEPPRDYERPAPAPEGPGPAPGPFAEPPPG